MRNLFLITIAGTFLIIASCRTKNITCSPGGVTIQSVGFTKADLDSAIAVRYKPDNTFATPLDTATKLAWTWNANIDTATLRPLFNTVALEGGSAYFRSDYDYRIIFKTLARTFEVTGITLAGNTHQSYTESIMSPAILVTCTNNVVSCKINNQAYTFTGNTATVCIVK
jgi:hypothetical protein